MLLRRGHASVFTPKNKILRKVHLSLLVAASVILARPSAATDSLHGLSPPFWRVDLLVDSRIETPPVPNGGPVSPLPAQGQTIEFQVFVPNAIGKRAFGYILEFEDTNRAFADNFEVVSAKTRVLLPAPYTPQGGIKPAVLVDRELQTLQGSKAPGRSVVFVNPPIVSPEGLIATFILLAKRNVTRNVALTIHISATVISTTSPTRLWNMRGSQTIRWM